MSVVFRGWKPNNRHIRGDGCHISRAFAFSTTTRNGLNTTTAAVGAEQGHVVPCGAAVPYLYLNMSLLLLKGFFHVSLPRGSGCNAA